MKYVTLIVAAGLILTVTATAGATSYVSTFVVEGDFSLTGFSSGGVPTYGPDQLDITNVTGTYDMNIPPAGEFWDVYSAGTFWMDFDNDGTTDATGDWNEYLGNFASPGPAGVDTHWGPGYFEFPVTAVTGSGTYICQMRLDYDIYFGAGATPLSGSFGTGAFAKYTLTGVDYWGLAAMYGGNTELTDQDNASGGGDGIIDGRMGYTQTISAVPEPLTMLAVGMGIAGLAGYIRKRKLA